MIRSGGTECMLGDMCCLESMLSFSVAFFSGAAEILCRGFPNDQARD